MDTTRYQFMVGTNRYHSIGGHQRISLFNWTLPDITLEMNSTRYPFIVGHKLISFYRYTPPDITIYKYTTRYYFIFGYKQIIFYSRHNQISFYS
jgi:hypothetical protein